MKRPAEAAGAGGSVAVVVAGLAGVKDPTTLVAIGAAVGLVPGAVTFLVTNGGVRGIARLVWRGRSRR